MKKTVIILSVIILCLLTSLVILLNTNLKMDSYDLVLIDSEPSNVVSFHINYGDFTDQYTTTGIVVGEDYIIDIAFSYIDEYMINIDVNSDFCPKCGANLKDEIECEYCGHLNPIYLNICEECKASLK